jgi:cold shock CspA family protein
MASARIKSWSNEKGFGYIEHPEYGDLLFDFEACDFQPEVGDEVEVIEVGKRYDGSPKATKVICSSKPRSGEKPPPPKIPS